MRFKTWREEENVFINDLTQNNRQKKKIEKVYLILEPMYLSI